MHIVSHLRDEVQEQGETLPAHLSGLWDALRRYRRMLELPEVDYSVPISFFSTFTVPHPRPLYVPQEIWESDEEIFIRAPTSSEEMVVLQIFSAGDIWLMIARAFLRVAFEDGQEVSEIERCGTADLSLHDGDQRDDDGDDDDGEEEEEDDEK